MRERALKDYLEIHGTPPMRELNDLPDLGGGIPDLGGSVPDLGGSVPDLGGNVPDLGGGIPDMEALASGDLSGSSSGGGGKSGCRGKPYCKENLIKAAIICVLVFLIMFFMSKKRVLRQTDKKQKTINKPIEEKDRMGLYRSLFNKENNFKAKFKKNRKLNWNKLKNDYFPKSEGKIRSLSIKVLKNMVGKQFNKKNFDNEFNTAKKFIANNNKNGKMQLNIPTMTRMLREYVLKYHKIDIAQRKAVMYTVLGGLQNKIPFIVKLIGHK